VSAKSLFTKKHDIISNTFKWTSPKTCRFAQNHGTATDNIADHFGWESNNTGAMLLIQYLIPRQKMLCVVNVNRPETDNFRDAVEHINSIILETGIPFSGLINNTHMLNETTVEDIIKGHMLCREISEAIGVPLLFDSCRQNLVKALTEEGERRNLKLNIYPIKLYATIFATITYFRPNSRTPYLAGQSGQFRRRKQT
jgi:hypothetical protein